MDRVHAVARSVQYSDLSCIALPLWQPRVARILMNIWITDISQSIECVCVLHRVRTLNWICKSDVSYPHSAAFISLRLHNNCITTCTHATSVTERCVEYIIQIYNQRCHCHAAGSSWGAEAAEAGNQRSDLQNKRQVYALSYNGLILNLIVTKWSWLKIYRLLLLSDQQTKQQHKQMRKVNKKRFTHFRGCSLVLLNTWIIVKILWKLWAKS